VYVYRYIRSEGKVLKFLKYFFCPILSIDAERNGIKGYIENGAGVFLFSGGSFDILGRC
jgi:hypothetical protein